MRGKKATVQAIYTGLRIVKVMKLSCFWQHFRANPFVGRFADRVSGWHAKCFLRVPHYHHSASNVSTFPLYKSNFFCRYRLELAASAVAQKIYFFLLTLPASQSRKFLSEEERQFSAKLKTRFLLLPPSFIPRHNLIFVRGRKKGGKDK